MATIKQKVASKLKIEPELLLKMAKWGGKWGKFAADFDSWQSRTVDKGKGVYKDL